jgi:hypothetical protein
MARVVITIAKQDIASALRSQSVKLIVLLININLDYPYDELSSGSERKFLLKKPCFGGILHLIGKALTTEHALQVDLHVQAETGWGGTRTCSS